MLISARQHTCDDDARWQGIFNNGTIFRESYLTQKARMATFFKRIYIYYYTSLPTSKLSTLIEYTTQRLHGNFDHWSINNYAQR